MHKQYNYVRIAAAVPETRPGDVEQNVRNIISLMRESEKEGADITLFPELSVTSYTCGDLFYQKVLLDRALQGLEEIRKESESLQSVSVVGIPLMADTMLFNTAVCIHKGKILGIVPKTFIPNNNEYYETRWFSSAYDKRQGKIVVFGESLPFKNELIFRSSDRREFSFSIEICEDLWAVVPPGSYSSLMGAEIILNLSASNELAGKASYRKNLVINQSGRCMGAYAYASSGPGESTTDTVFGGHMLIAENGKLMGENNRFKRTNDLLVRDVDIDIIRHERMNNVSFSRGMVPLSVKENYEYVNFDNRTEKSTADLLREIETHPFVPQMHENRVERCEEIFSIQSTGLATRLKHASLYRTVIGLSGGLDSTLALLVMIEAYKKLDLSPEGIHCLTMPGFGTTKRTKDNVRELCDALKLELTTINIVSAVRQHFNDIGHDERTTNTVYENTQARERTQILMDMANKENALVIGTGDLSELALGWCTYNGDHMSMYAVNSGVPKTLVSFLIQYYADYRADKKTARILKDILDTPISPELLPPDRKGNISQFTENVIGPYELHDFFLYHAVRYGIRPQKILFLAEHAFGKKYSPKTMKKWLLVFYRKFFSQQFKRSAIPDGPKVGTIALSPRADWRMPSDASAEVWLEEIEDGNS